MFMTKNKWLWESLAALALATLNVWMLDHLAGRGPIRLMLAQAWSGMLVVCALAYVAGVLPKQFGVETTANDDSLATSRGQAWLRISIWTGCCASAWLTLPAGGSLGLMAAVIFFTLVWMNGPVDLPKSAFRTGFAIAITLVILLLVLAILDRPWRLARIIADFSGPLDLQGRHYFHGLILKVHFSLREFTNLADSFPAHLSKTSGLELLKFASWAGALASRHNKRRSVTGPTTAPRSGTGRHARSNFTIKHTVEFWYIETSFWCRPATAHLECRLVDTLGISRLGSLPGLWAAQAEFRRYRKGCEAKVLACPRRLGRHGDDGGNCSGCFGKCSQGRIFGNGTNRQPKIFPPRHS
jgi:hypothetical protein